MSRVPCYSAVISCYFEEQTIDTFHRRLTDGLRATGESYEIVYVNDGSTDGTLERLKAIYHQDAHVRCVIDFMKNSGQTAGWTAGITRANGHYIVLIDSDLQFDPEELPLLHAKRIVGADFVTGYRSRNRQSLGRRLASKIANGVMTRFFSQRVIDIGCTYKIIHGNLVRAFDLGPTRIINMLQVMGLAGRIEEVEVTHRERPHGRSGWSVISLFDYFLALAMSQNRRPFQAIALLMTGAALLLLLRVSLAFFIDFRIIPTVTTGLLFNAQVAIALFVVAILSLVGEYLIRTFDLAQGRPHYVLREVLDKDAGDGA